MGKINNNSNLPAFDSKKLSNLMVKRNIGASQLEKKTGIHKTTISHLKNGSYGLVEIKLGGDKLIEDGAANLLKLKDKIDSSKMKEPSFLMILCAVAPYAYKRKDGVLVVPIGCLKD